MTSIKTSWVKRLAISWIAGATLFAGNALAQQEIPPQPQTQPIMPAPASRECVTVCDSSCVPFAERAPNAQCAAVDPNSDRICYVMFGNCGMGKDKTCGWQPDPDFQKCLSNPHSYSQQYQEYQRLMLERE